MDEKFFVLLWLLKGMRMLGESEILSFFVSGANQGELGGGVHPRECNPRDQANSQNFHK